MNKRQRIKLVKKIFKKPSQKVRNKIRREAKRRTAGSSPVDTGRHWGHEDSDPVKDLENLHASITSDFYDTKNHNLGIITSDYYNTKDHNLD